MGKGRRAVAMTTLVALSAAAPTSLNIILPSLPAIQRAFAATLATTQLLISLSLVGVALATLAYGPVSDRYGRRPVLLAGMALFLLGSVICAAAPDMATLIAGRIVLAAGGAAGLVLARAVVRDLHDREATARVLAYLTMAMAVAPMIAPLAGGLIVERYSWRIVFVVLAAMGALILIDVAWRLPESHHARIRLPGIGGILGGFRRLLRVPAFCGYALHQSFSMSTFYIFASTAPYLMVEVLKRPPTEYGLYFILLSVAFIVGTFVTSRLVPLLGLDRMIMVGSLVAIAACAVGFALALDGIWTPLAIYLPAVALGCANGLTMPNSQAGAVSIDPAAAGTASGLVGFMQMLCAALATQLLSMVELTSPVPMTGAMLVLTVLALIAQLVATRRQRRQPPALAAG
jgi:DHA1 family bicyclomycin/chloramphenicol resistance-like MFS transporter